MNNDVIELIKRNKKKLPVEDLCILNNVLIPHDVTLAADIHNKEKELNDLRDLRMRNDIQIIKIFQKHNI